MLAAWRVDPKHDGFKHIVHFNCGGLNCCMLPLLADLGVQLLQNTIETQFQDQGAYPRSLNQQPTPNIFFSISQYVGEAMRIEIRS